MFLKDASDGFMRLLVPNPCCLGAIWRVRLSFDPFYFQAVPSEKSKNISNFKFTNLKTHFEQSCEHSLSFLRAFPKVLRAFPKTLTSIPLNEHKMNFLQTF